MNQGDTGRGPGAIDLANVSARDLTIDQRSFSQAVYQQSVNQRILLSLGVGRSPHQRLVAAARRLAIDVHDREANELARLVGDSAAAQVAHVEFAAPPLLHWRTDGGPRRGDLTQIRSYYGSLNRGRLVVEGGGGSGKTVLALTLARDLAASLLSMLSADSDDEGARVGWARVGVRLSAAEFDPSGGDTGRLNPELVARRFDEWVGNHLRTVHGVHERDANGLISAGWIIPILDGIDEMDARGQTAWRAATLIAALNRPVGFTPSGLRPVVMTCRSDRYQELTDPVRVELTGSTLSRGGLEDATVVRLEPLTPEAVQKYITYRFPDPAGSDRGEMRWRPILGRLRDAHGDSGTPSTDEGIQSDPLVATLQSPLMLFLAVDGYRDPMTDPKQLMTFAETSSLRAHLYGRYIPAVTSWLSGPEGSRYSREQVSRWLICLSRHLKTQEGSGGSGTDIYLTQLWRVAGPRLPRFLAATVCALLAAIAGGYLGLTYLQRVGLPSNAASALVAVEFMIYPVWIGFRGANPSNVVERIDLRRLRTSRGRLSFFTWVAFGTLFGALSCQAVVRIMMALGAPSQDFSQALFAGALFGGLTTVAVALEKGAESISAPSHLIFQGITQISVRATVTILSPVLLVGILSPRLNLPAGNLTSAVLVGVVLALFWISRSPWPCYAIACVIVARRGELPLRAAHFLDWAHDAGLVRISGLSIQFRHRDFQEWLLQASETRDSTDLGQRA